MGSRFQELNLSSAFLFAAALEDKETCQMILEIILDRPVGEVKVRAEQSILFHADCRSIRLDIYASDQMEVGYNLEMQNENQGNLAKRSRYHQAKMDVAALKPGQDFNLLKPGYVVFICTFDPFKRGFYRYTFEERCREAVFPLGDGTRKIFLNTRGKNDGDVPKELADFLHYVERSTDQFAGETKSAAVKRIHQKIQELKQDRRLEEEYMTVEDLIEQEGRRRAKEAQGKVLRLITLMTEAGETGLIPRLEKEPELLEKMLEKYHL